MSNLNNKKFGKTVSLQVPRTKDVHLTVNNDYVKGLLILFVLIYLDVPSEIRALLDFDDLPKRPLHHSPRWMFVCFKMNKRSN